MSRIDRVRMGCDELFKKGNYDFIDNLFSKNYIAHAGNKKYNGHEFIRKFIEQLRSSIPDLLVVKVEILIESDNTITWQRTLCGTHKATIMGVKPSKQKVEWRDMIVSHFEDDKIVEEWLVSELAGELLSKPPQI